jgi:hypothetical protein
MSGEYLYAPESAFHSPLVVVQAVPTEFVVRFRCNTMNCTGGLDTLKMASSALQTWGRSFHVLTQA